MTERALNQLASTGESASLEFKHRVPEGNRIAKELIAFANAEGGRLLVGVEDDGTVAGVADPAEEEFALRRAMQEHSQPVVEYSLERVTLPSQRQALVVTVRESARKPHLLVNGFSEPGTAYVRVEDMSVEASPEALRLMRTNDEPNGVTFEFGDREQTLMRYLDDYGRITVRQYATLIDEPREKASDVLTTLAQADVLQIHASDDEDYFTLAY